MATEPVSKSVFIAQQLKLNKKANVDAINEAWKKAGHDGSISNSLLQKVKSDEGLTKKRGPRRGRPKARVQVAERSTGRSAEAVAPAARTTGRGRRGRPAARPVALNGAPRSLQTKLLDQVEGQIDELIFQLKTAGGVPDVEAALRAARRLLARGE